MKDKKLKDLLFKIQNLIYRLKLNQLVGVESVESIG